MNVLYLSYDGLTDGLGRSQVLPYIMGLEELGHAFTVISFEKRHRYDSDGRSIELLLKDSNIRWIPLFYTANPPIVSTVYDVLRLKRKVEELDDQTPFDIIHCRSYITSLVGLHMKRSRGSRFVFDMRAFYADERIDGGLWNLKNPIFNLVYEYFKKKELEFLRFADHSISLTGKGRNIIHGWKQIQGQPIPIKIIPCCADLTHFHPAKVNKTLRAELSERLNLNPKDFVLAYLGSVGTWYMLEEMLDFFKLLLTVRPNSKFLFITNENPDELTQKAIERGIDKERIPIISAKREDVPTFLSLANAGIFFIKPVFSKSGSSPTKHGEMLGMGLPIIANSGVGDIDSIITSTNSGILVDHFTNDGYMEAISQLDKLIDIPVSTLQDAANQYYSLDEGIKRYNEVYESVMEINDDTSHS